MSVRTTSSARVSRTDRCSFHIRAITASCATNADTSSSARKQRLIAGPAYWFPVTKSGVAAAVLLNFEQIRYMGAPNQRPTEERYALSTLFNF